MKNWILMIMSVNSSLERLTENIDKKVESVALTFAGDTISKVETIIKLNDKKISLINLRVMYEKFCEKLSDEEIKMLKDFAFGKSVRQLAQEKGNAISTTYRKLSKAFKKAESVLVAIGFDENRFLSYLQFPYIKAKIKAIKRRTKSEEIA